MRGHVMSRISSTMRAARSARTVSVEPKLRLAVTRGPDAGKVFVLDGTEAPRVLLGTSPACELALTDRQVSRRHLSLELSGGVLRIRDLDSTNGTVVHGVSVIEARLRGGETIGVGETEIEVLRGEEEGEPFVSDDTGFGRYLGRSDVMRRLYPTCARLAAADVPLVIEGETGTGKELLAEAIHEASKRAGGPFVVFDCAASSGPGAEAVLFGSGDQPGLFEEANGGTLLIDEIAELDAELQPKLLRAIDKGIIRRVAGATATPVDVRVVASTRRDLDREVGEGRFREDLFFRVAVTRIELPPLRRRTGDVELLAAHFWAKATGDDGSAPPRGAVERMLGYEWPGNVRELANFVARLYAVGETRGGKAAPPPAPGADFIGAVIAEHLALGPARDKVIAEFERRYVEDAYERNGRNVTRAAEAAGIARRYFRALRARQR